MLRSILTICRSVEQAAEQAYRAISNQTGNDREKAFWLEIARDEERHATYWGQLMELEERGSLGNPLDDHQRILTELSAMKAEIDETCDRNHRSYGFSNLILWAFRLESYMLHPAFAILFHCLRTEDGEPSPEDDYHDHIQKFTQAVKNHLSDKPELALIGEILSTMWQRNAELAHQFAQIKTLRGLIPICASCKQIRNEQGYWESIEAYVRRFSEAEFSHGICQECARKLYPELS